MAKEHVTETPIVESGSSVSEGFGTTALTKSAETASAAVASQAQAAVQARYVMALRKPRDFDDVRVRLLKECSRPSFAAVARYRKPIGKGVEGPSIRFAEAALRCMGNVDQTTQAIFDSPEKRIVRVTVTDLESNLSYSSDITIEKTVERSRLQPGEKPISTRTNSKGYTTYLLPATPDDLLNKESALVSKAVRTLALRVVPGDLVDEGQWRVQETMRNEDAKDPDAARKRMVDGFAGIGVKPGDLKSYMGTDLDSLSPADLAHLRGLFAAIRDGETTWKEVVDNKAKAESANAPTSLKDRVKAKAAAATPKPAPVAPVAVVIEREPGDDSDEVYVDDEERAALIEQGLA